MSYRLPPPVAGIVQASSPSTTSVALPHYYQQTTSSILDSALVFTFIATVACLLLFSFARTRRTSIYSSRQFFVRDEHQADAFSSTLFGWITPLLFLERKLEMVLREQKSSLGAHHRSSVSEKEIGTTSNAPVSDQQHQLSDHDVTSTRKSRWESIRPSFLGRANTASYVQDGVKSNGFPINASSASETSSHRPSTFQSDINTEVARDAIVAKIGLDHYLLVRFLKMLFTLSAVIAVTALVVLIPVYSIGQSGEDLLTTGEIMEEDGAEGPRILKLGGGWFASKRVEMLQIGNVTDNERLWAAVVIVAIFSAFVFIWVWSELMEFLKLRQSFLFRSASRYSSRVVLLQHLPPGLRSVAELKQAFANADGGVEYVYPVHDVTALDKAVKRRQVVLDRLEEAEFRYMDAIARASTMVATTTLSMRSRSWFGELVDKTKAFFGLEKTNAVPGSNNIGGQGNIGGVLSSNPEDEDYVGPLKMYQLEDVPKLSLTDLSSPASGSTPSPNTPTRGITSAVSSFAGTAASLTALKWFQKPRRPRHYAGIPLLSKRQDSIRYYRELCQYWGQVSKTQGELLMQRYYFLYLVVNMALIHPILSLSFSWQGSTLTEMNSLSAFLIHAMPSYCSFAFAYILMSGVALPLLHLLQLPRLWATLPEVTLWSVLGPLSWRKSIRNGPKRPSNDSSSKCSTTTSSASSTAASSAFEANFTPAPTQTPRQAFQIRQPPFFYLQNLYPHLVLLFLISLTLLPLAPVLFLLWIVVLLVLNICYRYLILQVVTTKSQSGGLHYIQAINLLLFPTLACPPALLTIYLLIRQAWVQASFALVLTFAVVAMRFLFATQFGKREEMMLAKVENYHSQPKVLKLHAGQGGRSNAAGAATTTTLTAVASTNDSIMDLRQTQLGGEGLQPMVEESESDNDSAGTDRLSPGRRRTRRMIKRPTTIIGQVRNSMFSSVSQASSSHRPKSVPVFDLERYEKEILGINREQDSVRDSGTLSSTRKSSSHHQLSQIQSQEDGGKELNGEASKEQQTHTSLVRSKTIATTTPTFDPTTSEVAFSDLFSEYTHSTKLADSALSKAEEEEDEKEAKYREIVIALRRASSVASQRLPEFVNSTGALDNPGRRVRVGPVAALGNRHGGPYNANNSSKDNFRASLPALSKYPSISGRAHRPQRSLGGALSNISMSPQRSGGVGGRGAPSLPMLLIHRESAVAAKEWHRIQNLYLHPVLAEARSRVIVWLPSQTEQSFMGLSRESQGAAARFLAQCKMHNPTSPSSSTKASGFSALTLTPGVDQGAIAGQQHAHTSHHICSCQLYQELLKAVADAVALADQEVRDLRIVGLTVWLDSRHVVWGQPSEEDGRLGDRVMIAGGPSSSTLVPGGGASHQTGGTLIGDGLLSWLEEEDREGGGRGEEEDEEMGMGPGAPGIVGGSMGVIMKRPIGSYGRLVGNGEEDDISRGLL
ncbi:hypothetical protein BGZ52_009980 [Haplosporangium bisporale]|nr:hypothetical protein BGZ52_009980 [Haplosporangium bisporale]